MTRMQKIGALLSSVAISIVAVSAVTAGEVDHKLHDAMPEIYKTNGVNVAVFNDWPPDEFVENGELKGWSVDMAKAMSERLGVQFNFTGTSFDAIIPGLVSRRFDAGFSSFGVTPERLQALDFVAQRREGTGYAFLKGKGFKIDVESDLCGHSIAVMTGAWDYQYLSNVSQEQCVSAGKPPIDLQQFTTQNAAELAVSSDRVEIIAAGSAKLMYLAKQTDRFDISPLISNAVFNGIGIRRDDALGPILTDVLQSMINDGTYKALMAKWGVDKSGMLDKAVLVNKNNPADR